MARHLLPPVRRRVVLGVVLAGGAGALAGCDQVTGGRPSRSTPPATGTSPSPTTVSDPDRSLVVQALAGTVLLLAELDAGPVRRARESAPLRRLHRAHRDVLVGALGGPGPESSPGPTTGLTRREIPVREAALQAELVAAAAQAQDGLVARLLAVMSAAIAQSLAVLPEPGPPPNQPQAGTSGPTGASA